MVYEQVAEVALAGYGAFWAGLNVYNTYPLARGYLSAKLHGTGGKREDATVEPSFRDVDVFLPAYDEAGVIEHPLRSIAAADYPQDRIATYVIVEEADAGMQEAIPDLQEEYDFEAITVPDTYPGEPNKPRAMNYAFERTDGEVVGILDAEDVVDRDLFREAVTELEDTDYVQGRLDMANEADGWLNTLFRGEYGHWFNRQLPAFHDAGYPVPLAGTTCFFDRTTLDEASNIRREHYSTVFDAEDRIALSELGLDGDAPWNPENVTEDFELGMLLWTEGYDMGYLESVTREESPRTLEGWMKQRTRWQKGKLQTLDACRENPPERWRDRFHIYGQSSLAHLGPVNAVGLAATTTTYAAQVDLPWELDALLGLGAVSVLGYGALQAEGYDTATERGSEDPSWRSRYAANALTFPLYWGLQWAADARAVKQFYTGDDAWEKTEHHAAHVEEPIEEEV